MTTHLRLAAMFTTPPTGMLMNEGYSRAPLFAPTAPETVNVPVEYHRSAVVEAASAFAHCQPRAVQDGDELVSARSESHPPIVRRCPVRWPWQ